MKKKIWYSFMAIGAVTILASIVAHKLRKNLEEFDFELGDWWK